MRIKERCLHFSLSKTEGDVTSFQTPTSTDDFVRVPLGKQKGENTSTFSADLPCRSRHATRPRAQTLHLPPSTGGHRHTVFFFLYILSNISKTENTEKQYLHKTAQREITGTVGMWLTVLISIRKNKGGEGSGMQTGSLDVDVPRP